MGGHVNHDDNIDVTYLPISMGYRVCYKQYMKSLGYDIQTTALGGFVVTAEDDGKEVDPSEYVTFPTYFNMWKRDYKDLRVSRPVEDICKDCYVFANWHRHLANHTMRQEMGDDGSKDSDDNNTSYADVDSNFADDDGEPTMEANIDQPDAAGNPNEEMRELMLHQAAEHVKMARIQRLLYQQKVAEVVEDAKKGRAHSERRYTFVVDYGQNMELPIFNKEQP